MTNQNTDIPDLPFLSGKPAPREPLPATEPSQGYDAPAETGAASETGTTEPRATPEPEKANLTESSDKARHLTEAAQAVRNCRKCPLGFQRTNAVPGEGPPDARIMFIAEGPGRNEDMQGKPFVGAAGTFLDELLEMSGLNRKDVFVTNMIKCQAPGNRDPKPDEIEACSEHLDRQMEVIDPDIVVALGKFSLGKFLPGETIGKAGGTLRRRKGRNIYPIMHPAAGLRRGEFKERVIKDFLALPQALKQAQENPPEEEPEPPVRNEEFAEQKSLF